MSPLAQAAGPAVSNPAGKVSLQGGDLNGKDASSADGALTLPIGQLFGLQVDASSGRFLDRSYRGLGGHAFWRDPDQGLAGITSAYQKLGDQGNRRNGAEGELYLDRYTVILRAGEQTGDGPHGAYEGVGLRWYLTQNLSLNLGFDHSPGVVNTTGIGVEWQPVRWGVPGLALFARGTHSVANDQIGDSHAVSVGVRYYFGAPKSLMTHHRTDDPDSIVMPLGDVIPTPTIIPAPPPAPVPAVVTPPPAPVVTPPPD
ncbi:hypothetical protein [Paludibacterium sp.]|uniref:hypothetical protein n=1 Tax=Paludibacterium sp. TaxID=1917523 RepID=UPI0025DAA657|nr:hypothetical protein [Paludibacterium sp.]